MRPKHRQDWRIRDGPAPTPDGRKRIRALPLQRRAQRLWASGRARRETNPADLQYRQSDPAYTISCFQGHAADRFYHRWRVELYPVWETPTEYPGDATAARIERQCVKRGSR